MSVSLELEDFDEDSLKILVATDIHLGYLEKDLVRDEDSFIAFEEILKIAVREEVDFILLGGDLFHDCKPSPYCIQKSSELIRRYCFGDKPVTIEFLSDQSYHFKHLKNPVVNYEDPNINVSIPIFSIHGNHDDPSGNKSISAIDLLATNGLINYFGRWTNLKQVDVVPIYLKKGENKMAIYGLSHIHDQRLARLFRDQKVTMDKLDDDSWFNLLVLHQNRANRGANNYIPSAFIPNFMNLVVWGHEHDCYIEPEKQENGVWITQPGSSVATSLSEGEAREKHVGLLYVKDKQFFMKPIPLQTVRPFIFKTITLKDISLLKDTNIHDYSKDAMETVAKEIESIINRVKEEREERGLKATLPLVRIVMRYHDERQQFNAIRFNQNFTSRVANSNDIILQKAIIKKSTGKNKFAGDDLDTSEFDSETSRVNYVIELIDQEIDKLAGSKAMKVLSVKGLGHAVTRFIEAADADALSDLVQYQIDSTIEKLNEMDVGEDNIEQAINFLYENRKTVTEETEISEITKMFENENRKFKRLAEDVVDDDDVDGGIDVSAAEDAPAPSKPSRGRGSRGPRRPRGRK